jgi:predicted secreted protein
MALRLCSLAKEAGQLLRLNLAEAGINRGHTRRETFYQISLCDALARHALERYRSSGGKKHKVVRGMKN